MKVSIVTISFNQGRFLSRAMTSVLSQDHRDVEYIVVDPGSTDLSRDIIASHASRLAHVVLEPDSGPADGLNRGFEHATGDVLAYVNADDALLPGAVREAVAYLTANANVDVVYGDGYLVDGDGHVIREIDSSPFNLRRYSHGHVTVLQPATFIRRSAFERVGGFNAENQVSWDGELIVDIALDGGTLRHAQRRWAAWTIHPQTISSSADYLTRWRSEKDRLFQKIHGRPYRNQDFALGLVARLERWVVSPRTTLWRTAGLLRGRPGLLLLEQPGPSVELIPAKAASSR
jgi:glycosyltransferase involved in cell wall biosynthesis